MKKIDSKINAATCENQLPACAISRSRGSAESEESFEHKKEKESFTDEFAQRNETFSISFAPANVKFVPPDGLGSFEEFGKNFKFSINPLSPTSANNFFLPAQSKASIDLQFELNLKGN